MDFSWSQLTTISVERCALPAAEHILRHSASLVDFRGTLGRNFDDYRPGQIPPLMHLESLTLDDRSPNFPGTQKALLDALTTPALRHLALSELELGLDPLSTITSMLSRSKCSLDSLFITYSERDEADYRAAFPLINVITVFKKAMDGPDNEGGEIDEADEGSDDESDERSGDEVDEEGDDEVDEGSGDDTG
ncbi:hypothetical protein C8J57DRAFT_1726551 [Mycena rebaudengoi]|nr:hypothetical protein C8J57DRAFT_1726551 [Mycena rebaudengoi]